MGYIYKITNDINKKIYIGQTINNIEYRFKSHLQDNRQDNNKFHNALKKYGQEHFQIEQIEECPNELLDEREKYWIQYYDSVNNGYNTTWGGANGVHYDRNQILKLWNQGLNIIKISEQLGMQRSILAQALRALNITDDEIKQRHYKAAKTQITNRKVYQINPKNGQIIKQWDRISDIEEELHLNHSSIIACCNLYPQHKTAGGYAWRYIENYNPNIDKEKLIQQSRKVPNNSKIILQFDQNNNLLNQYINATDAAQKTGISKSSITKYCRGERKDSHGYIWKYK